jgi:hypothetical protein
MGEKNINDKSIVIETPPSILYKYADWHNPHHKCLLTVPEVYFASADSFNDPYDCGISARYDKWTQDDCISAWRPIIQNRNPEASDKEIDAELELYLQNHRLNPEKTSMDIDNMQLKYVHERMGIFALSEHNDSTLMWSHYSNKHQGLCIGYNTPKLGEIIEDHIRAIYLKPIMIHFLKVKYKREYPEIYHDPRQISMEVFFARLLTKFEDWHYEDEWRIIIGINPRSKALERKVPIKIDAIGNIWLGLRMPESDIADIIQTLKRFNYAGELFKAKQIRYSYRLDFEPIKY